MMNHPLRKIPNTFGSGRVQDSAVFFNPAAYNGPCSSMVASMRAISSGDS